MVRYLYSRAVFFFRFFICQVFSNSLRRDDSPLLFPFRYGSTIDDILFCRIRIRPTRSSVAHVTSSIYSLRRCNVCGFIQKSYEKQITPNDGLGEDVRVISCLHDVKIVKTCLISMVIPRSHVDVEQ